MINWGVCDVKVQTAGREERKSPHIKGLGHDDRYPRHDPHDRHVGRVATGSDGDV